MRNVKHIAKKLLFGAVVATGLVVSASSVRASPIMVTGNVADNADMTFSDFQATLNYNNVTDQLTIQLTNTSPNGPGGSGILTGFLFDIDQAGDSAALTSATDANFWDLASSRHSHALEATPFGTFQAGAGLGGVFIGGGVPTTGLAVGQTGDFTFNVTGPTAATLTTADFTNDGFITSFEDVNLLSADGPDRVPGEVVCAPLPKSAWAGLVGLACAAGAGAVGMQRRRRMVVA